MPIYKNPIVVHQQQTSKVHVYGVEWDGSQTSDWSRIDDSAYFSDPIPYYAGMTETPSSPFDGLYPWSTIERVANEVGVFVKIPKFWYKITALANNGIRVEIADAPTDGFDVSPAHRERGDQSGERDVVLIARYLADSASKSTTGVLPAANTSISAARNNTQSRLGSEYWVQDYAMYWTIRLLYLVEFASWDCQRKIGAGRSYSSTLHKNGETDTIPYHTGTTMTSKSADGGSTQYRWIENVWGINEWIDGIYIPKTMGADVKTSLFVGDYQNVASVGIKIGTVTETTAGIVRSMNVPQRKGLSWSMFLKKTDESGNYNDNTHYTTDGYNGQSRGGYCRTAASSTLMAGGLFYLYVGNGATDYDATITHRTMMLPGYSK